MNNKIFKCKLEAKEKQILKLPFKSVILSAIEQRDNIVLYALVDEHQGIQDNYEIVIVETGNPVTYDINEYKFLNTVSLLSGDLVFHIFYKSIKNV